MSLPLHPEKGVNPRVTCCRNCGKDVGVVLLGAHDGIYKCSDCGQMFIGPPDRRHPCKINHHSIQRTGKVEEHEKLPIEVCEECMQKEKECDQVVKEGGVYWKCEDCGSGGAIKASAPLAQAVRKQMNIDPPNPVGVTFTKDDCPSCGQ